MTTKHTPGPWAIWKFSDHEADLAVGAKVGGIAVAEIVTSEANGIRTQPSVALGEANARLIAAAPELLEACKRALEYAPNEIEANVLRQAIAKAEGKQV